MEEKPVAGLVTAIIAAPLVALCCAGPIVIVSALSGAAGWLGGLNGALVMVFALVAGAAAFGFVQWRKARALPTDEGPVDSVEAPERRPDVIGAVPCSLCFPTLSASQYRDRRPP